MPESKSKIGRKSKSWKKLPRFTVQLETFIQKEVAEVIRYWKRCTKS